MRIVFKYNEVASKVVAMFLLQIIILCGIKIQIFGMPVGQSFKDEYKYKQYQNLAHTLSHVFLLVLNSLKSFKRLRLLAPFGINGVQQIFLLNTTQQQPLNRFS